MLMYRDRNEGGFLNSLDLAKILEDLSIPTDEGAIKVVGVGVAPTEMRRCNGEPLVPNEGFWEIPPRELIRVEFGIELPTKLAESGITPVLHWRSSNHRCGGGGLDFYATDTEVSDKPSDGVTLLGGKLCGNYMAFNPYGIKVECGVAMAQLSLMVGQATPEISEPLTVGQIERFDSFGQLTRTRTILPTTTVVEPQKHGWVLKRNTPYLVTFNGQVDLSPTQAIIPSRHLSDLLENPGFFEVSGHSCLGDPGYRGRLGMLVIALGYADSAPLIVGAGQGIGRRVARYSVVVGSGQEDLLSVYGTAGQYQGEGWDDKTPLMRFKPWHDWTELRNVRGPTSLREMFEFRQ